MRAKCEHFTIDARQLWRRLLFNHLITNVDDHLQNIGFLYSGHNLWRLSPAFDLNPFPDKAAESKTWTLRAGVEEAPSNLSLRTHVAAPWVGGAFARAAPPRPHPKHTK